MVLKKNQKYFICNREFDSLSPSHKLIWEKLSTIENSKFLYESPKQNILSQNSERYSLKLGVDLFWKKEHIKKYKKYLKELNYGNKRIGKDVTDFWLDESLRITAFEEIRFLKQLQAKNIITIFVFTQFLLLCNLYLLLSVLRHHLTLHLS